MRKYIINEMFSDGYERFAVIEEVGKKSKMNVYFLECDEYLENGEESKKRKKGDLLEGEIFIDLVVYNQKVDKDLFFYQEIPKSPNIEAIVEVVQIIDDYSVYARTSIFEENIRIEFEQKENYEIGERVLVEGFLTMDVEDKV